MRCFRLQRNRSTFGVLLLGLPVLAGCRPAPPAAVDRPARTIDLLANPTGPLISETWAVHYVRGAKVGHRRTRVFREEGQDADLRRIVSDDELEMRRFGDVARQALTTASLETDEGRVRQLAYRVRNGDSVTTVVGIVDQGQLELARPGSDQAVRFTWSHQQGGIFAIERSLQRQPMQPGERRSIESFMPLLDRIVKTELVAQQLEPTPIGSESRELLRVEATDMLSEGWKIPTLYWVDPSGTIVKTQEAFLERETLLATADEANRRNDFLQLDLGVDVGVPVKTPIAQPLDTNYAVYRVKVEGLRPEDVFPTTLSQRVLAGADGSALITVAKVTPQDPEVPDVTGDAPTPEDTAPNALIQSDHPRVRALADAVAGSVDDPWQAAVLLEHYLFGVLSKEDFSQVFSSAAEVAEQRRGDCSEHAVLLAATCRARGIPARVAVGLLYSDEDQSFLYHMWTEVWIRDRWVPLDATLGRAGVGGCHLKFRDSNLAHQTPYSMISPVIYLIGKLQIEVVAAERERPR